MLLIVLSNVFTFLTIRTIKKNNLCWCMSVVMCKVSWLSLYLVLFSLRRALWHRRQMQNGIYIPGNGSLWTAIAARLSACESQCAWPAWSSACSSQPAILLLLWWVWLMTSSGPRCHIGPPLIVLSTASVGPDNRIRPGPYRPAGASLD